MIGKGTFEYEIGADGAKRKVGFKFGMYAAAITEKVAGCTMQEVLARIHGSRYVVGEGGKVVEEKIEGMATLSLLHYFYGGAVAYSQDESISLSDVADIIEAIGEAEAYTAFAKSLESYIPKNGQAPEKKKRPGPKTGV
jgi:hypothetical protein